MIARQPDGSYVLRFERVSVACEVALTEADLTEADLEALVMELQTALPTRSTP